MTFCGPCSPSNRSSAARDLDPPSEKRAARQAILAVRTRPVTLKPPARSAHLSPVAVWAVLAQEINPPAEVEGLEWMLLTTVEVKHKADAFERLEWYAKRWGIEVYHRILKSGCRVEARQLENVRRLRNCLAIDLVVAWRIYHLTTLGRETPEVSCTVYFTPSEWQALTTFVNKTKTPPDLPPSLNEAVRLGPARWPPGTHGRWPSGNRSPLARHGTPGRHRVRLRSLPLRAPMSPARKCRRPLVHDQLVGKDQLVGRGNKLLDSRYFFPSQREGIEGWAIENVTSRARTYRKPKRDGYIGRKSSPSATSSPSPSSSIKTRERFARTLRSLPRKAMCCRSVSNGCRRSVLSSPKRAALDFLPRGVPYLGSAMEFLVRELRGLARRTIWIATLPLSRYIRRVSSRSAGRYTERILDLLK